MKITRISIDNRKKELVILAGRHSYAYPFAFIRKGASVIKAAPDPEAANEAFTCHLSTGEEMVIHLDDVRAQIGDLDYGRELLLYNLTLTAQQEFKRRGLSKRAICRMLATSPAQVYRLLNQTCYTKTIDQMVRLLGAMGCSVKLEVCEAA